MIFRILLVGCLLSTTAQAQYSRIVVDGDSLFSSNNGLSNWTDFFNPGVPLFNNAAGGDLLTNIIGEFPSQDAPLWTNGAVFILEGGTGDLGAGSSGTNFQSVPAAQVYSNALAILHEATNAGYTHLFLCTVAPSSSIPPPTKDQNRQDYNSLVRAGTSNGYIVLDTAAWITDTNDLTYYQPDGIHWTDDFEQWLGILTIPDVLGYTSAGPELSIAISNTTATVSWNGLAYATNRLLESTSLSGPWLTVSNIVQGQATPMTVTLPLTNSPVYFRLFIEHVDFPTFIGLPH